jgi:hypothetical protein
VDKEKNAQIYCEICNRDKFEQEKNIDIRRLKFQSSLTKRHTVVTILT